MAIGSKDQKQVYLVWRLNAIDTPPEYSAVVSATSYRIAYLMLDWRYRRLSERHLEIREYTDPRHISEICRLSVTLLDEGLRNEGRLIYARIGGRVDIQPITTGRSRSGAQPL